MPDHSANSPWHVKSATGSWASPLVGILLFGFLGPEDATNGRITWLAVVASGSIICGFCLAVWAIVAAFAKGPKWILIPACFGLFICSFPIGAAIEGFQRRRAAAENDRIKVEFAASNDWIPGGADWYVDRENLLAIRFPTSWKTVVNPVKGAIVAAIGPDNLVQRKGRPVITINVGQLPPRTSYENAVILELQGLREVIPGYEESATGTRSLNGVEWSWVTYRQDKTSGYTNMTTFVAARNNRVYVVAFSLNPDLDEEFREHFYDSIETIRIP